MRAARPAGRAPTAIGALFFFVFMTLGLYLVACATSPPFLNHYPR